MALKILEGNSEYTTYLLTQSEAQMFSRLLDFVLKELGQDISPVYVDGYEIAVISALVEDLEAVLNALEIPIIDTDF